MSDKRFKLKLGRFYDNNSKGSMLDTILTDEEVLDLLNTLNDKNQQLKQELKMIYEISTANKVRNIIEEIYDDLLYETSEKSDYERRVVLKCLEKIDDFRDDLE